jgi:hypothetical protein
MSSAAAENPLFEGQLEGHTPPALEIPAAAVPLASVEQLDLLGEAAETSNARRRGAGRPEGSGNKRNAETFDYLEALGFKGPERLLMEVVSADPRQLAAQLAGTDDPRHVPFDRALEVLKLQIKAAADLMPYKLARKPQAIEVSRKELHLFVAGTLSEAQQSLIQQNQWVSVEDAVREKDNASHDAAIIEADQRLDGA